MKNKKVENWKKQETLPCGCVIRADGSVVDHCPRHQYLFDTSEEGGVGR